jgi:hypothetical protein
VTAAVILLLQQRPLRRLQQLVRQFVQSVSTFWYAAVLLALRLHLPWYKTMPVAAQRWMLCGGYLPRWLRLRRHRAEALLLRNLPRGRTAMKVAVGYGGRICWSW